MRTRPALVPQAAAREAASLAPPTGVVRQGTPATGRAVEPGGFYAFITRRAVPPLPPVLGGAGVTGGAVPVSRGHVPLADRAEPVPLALGQNHVSGTEVGEEPDGGLPAPRLPVLVERVIVIVHLIIQHGEGGEAFQDAGLKEVGEDPDHGHLLTAALWTLEGLPRVRDSGETVRQGFHQPSEWWVSHHDNLLRAFLAQEGLKNGFSSLRVKKVVVEHIIVAKFLFAVELSIPEINVQ